MINFKIVSVYSIRQISRFNFFLCGYSIVPAAFGNLFLLDCLGIFVENQLTIDEWVYFRTLYSVPLIHMSPLC